MDPEKTPFYPTNELELFDFRTNVMAYISEKGYVQYLVLSLDVH